jgi:hypothetical protein
MSSVCKDEDEDEAIHEKEEDKIISKKERQDLERVTTHVEEREIDVSQISDVSMSKTYILFRIMNKVLFLISLLL